MYVSSQLFTELLSLVINIIVKLGDTILVFDMDIVQTIYCDQCEIDSKINN